MTPLARTIRTAVQLAVALAGVVPLAVVFLGQAGVDVDGPRLVAVAGAAVTLVVGIQNGLEQAGLIPVLAAGVGMRERLGQAVPGAPLHTHAEIIDLVDQHVDGPSRGRILAELEARRRAAAGAVTVTVHEPAPRRHDRGIETRARR